MNKKIRAHIFVSGLVQGVFFRENNRKRTENLGITGFVRNLPDGKDQKLPELMGLILNGNIKVNSKILK